MAGIISRRRRIYSAIGPGDLSIDWETNTFYVYNVQKEHDGDTDALLLSSWHPFTAKVDIVTMIWLIKIDKSTNVLNSPIMYYQSELRLCFHKQTSAAFCDRWLSEYVRELKTQPLNVYGLFIKTNGDWLNRFSMIRLDLYRYLYVNLDICTYI